MEVGALITSIRHQRKYSYWESRVGELEPLMLFDKKIAVARIYEVELRRYDSIPLTLLRLDTEPDWSFERIFAYFKGHYKDLIVDDNVTLIWMEVTEIVEPGHRQRLVESNENPNLS